MKFFAPKTEYYVIQDRLTIHYPKKGKFIADWEWQYTFTEIWKNAYKTIKYYIVLLLINLSKKFGLIIKNEVETQTSLELFCEDEIVEFVYKNLQGMEYTKYLHRNECMVIFGPDILPKLRKLLYSQEFIGTFKMAKSEFGNVTYYVLDIPLYYFPNITGIHVLPDLSGKWKIRMAETQNSSNIWKRF